MRRLTTIRTSGRRSLLDDTVDDVWAVVASGAAGSQWYVDAVPWVVRGAIDRAVGGTGRDHPPPGRPMLQVGDRVGFWRVDELVAVGDQPRELLLTAIVRAPGVVDLRTTVEPRGTGCTLTQTVRLRPSGLLGWAYLGTDLPAREVVMELAHRRVLGDIARHRTRDEH